MLYPKFKKYIRDNGLLKKGNRVVAAVSGGVDSMVLLHLLTRIRDELDLKIVAAHVNYGLRGGESSLDEELVAKSCKKYCVEYEVLKKKPEAKKNLQDSARNIRYDFFDIVANKRNANVILTAHHEGDQAETVLLHLIRGAGLDGLSGIKPQLETRSRKVARPLLFASRSEIEGYARENKIEFRTDKTNKETKYSRNIIRHEIMGLLQKMNPNIEKALAATAARLGADREVLDMVAKEAALESDFAELHFGARLSRRVYARFPQALRKRILRYVYESIDGSSKDLNFDQLMRMDEMAVGSQKNASYRLPSRWKYNCRGDMILFERSSKKCDRS